MWGASLRVLMITHSMPVPKEVGLSARPHNPSIPSRSRIPSKYKALTDESLGTPTEGIGSERVYLDAFAHNASWPPRPPMGAIADLDAVLAHCDYNAGKVRPMPSPLPFPRVLRT